MNTIRLKVDAAHLESAEARAAIARAAEILRAGGLVALPTETVYGLGANALDAAAVERIFAAKRRPSWDPVIVHIAGPVNENPMLASLVTEIPAAARKLMSAFWPGPLTLLLPRSSRVPDAVTAGRPLVGVRMPAHPVAFRVIREAGVPVAAPSANLFSHTSPTTADHVLDDLDGRIDAILDAGPTRHGIESTVLDPSSNPLIIYRPGAITADQIRAAAGEVEMFAPPQPAAAAGAQDALPSPGVGIRHYAPQAHVILVEAPDHRFSQLLAAIASEHATQRLGVMLPAGWKAESMARAVFFNWGNWNAPEELGARLYAGLRQLDAEGCDVIVCPVPAGDGISAAIRDRLFKAAWNDGK